MASRRARAPNSSSRRTTLDFLSLCVFFSAFCGFFAKSWCCVSRVRRKYRCDNMYQPRRRNMVSDNIQERYRKAVNKHADASTRRKTNYFLSKYQNLLGRNSQETRQCGHGISAKTTVCILSTYMRRDFIQLTTKSAFDYIFYEHTCRNIGLGCIHLHYLLMTFGSRVYKPLIFIQ